MENLDEIELNIDKVKGLLSHLIEQNYAYDETNKKYESIQIENYYLKQVYHDTSLFLEVIFDYILETYEMLKN